MGKVPGCSAREKEVLLVNYLVAFLISLCLVLQHYIGEIWT